MPDFYAGAVDLGQVWIWSNFLIFVFAFGLALYLNWNFNTIMVGLIYLLPLIPVGVNADNLMRFVLVSLENTVFGLIELVIFVQTVRPGDAGFDKAHLQQLFGHTLPIAAALIGLSFVSRTTAVPVGLFEFALILTLFLLGSVLRVLAVYQLGRVAFKFDIVFRDEQRLMTEKLYRLMRHPTYTAMMLVILAYALTTHSLAAGLLGLLSAWVGFQYRIHHEEKALEECFGENYRKYRAGTGMWWPRWKRAPEGEGWINEE